MTQTSRELENRIHRFLQRKELRYPELSNTAIGKNARAQLERT